MHWCCIVVIDVKGTINDKVHDEDKCNDISRMVGIDDVACDMVL